MAHSRWEGIKRAREPQLAAYREAVRLGCPGENQALRTGWYGGGYHRRRWWWNPPWQWTRPWLPRAIRASDEYCNSTFLAILPAFLGGVVIRYRRGPLRVKPCDACILESDHHRLCLFCGDLWCPSLFPEE